MNAFAIYRLPHADQCTLVGQNGVPLELHSLKELGESSGFVIAPFRSGDKTPALLLHPDVVRQLSPDDALSLEDLPYYLDHGGEPMQPASKEAYFDDFSRFHRVISVSILPKLVLARSADVAHRGALDPCELFARACHAYPEAFVTLFSAPQCGTWLMATPEVLLTRGADRWHTMALAGTMRYTDPLPQWSAKNINEQDFVVQYIKSCLDRFSQDVELTGPYTTRAGHLVHLRTDFSFTLPSDGFLGTVLADLHPTPAVCGVPKQDALSFIIDNESIDRSYYSGFSGPVRLDGDTAMYVSLRCMRLMDDRYRLFAGGGILPHSVAESEWDETVAKMQAMLSLIET